MGEIEPGLRQQSRLACMLQVLPHSSTGTARPYGGLTVEDADIIRGIYPDHQRSRPSPSINCHTNPAHMVVGVRTVLRENSMKLTLRLAKPGPQKKYREMNELYQENALG